MAFDADKTKLIWVPLKKPDVKEQPILVFEDQDVSFTLELLEDLGILFVSTLPWTPILKKGDMMHTAVLSVSKKGPKAHLKFTKALAYQTYTQPFQMYGSQTWFPSKTNIEKLEKLQSSVTSWMSRETSYKCHLSHLKLLPISLLFQLSDIIFLH